MHQRVNQLTTIASRAASEELLFMIAGGHAVITHFFKNMEPTTSTTKSGEPARVPDPLEFPDWDGMDDSPLLITREAAFRLSECYPPSAVTTRSEGVDVEFVL
mgnify:FL=1